MLKGPETLNEYLYLFCQKINICLKLEQQEPNWVQKVDCYLFLKHLSVSYIYMEEGVHLTLPPRTLSVLVK